MDEKSIACVDLERIDQAKAAAAHQSGSGLSLMNGPSIQHVRLYQIGRAHV